MPERDYSRHDEVNGRLRAVLIVVADQLPALTVGLVDELIDAGEAPVALEMTSEMLVESDARLDPATLDLVDALIADLGLGREIVDRLLPLVR